MHTLRLTNDTVNCPRSRSILRRRKIFSYQRVQSFPACCARPVSEKSSRPQISRDLLQEPAPSAVCRMDALPSPAPVEDPLRAFLTNDRPATTWLARTRSAIPPVYITWHEASSEA